MTARMTVVIPILVQEAEPGHRTPESHLATIEKAIKCLLTYAIHPFDLLIVDNGSIPEAEKRIKALHLPNLTYIKHRDRARGMVEVINEAMQITSSELLAFMHDDFYVLGQNWDVKVYSLASVDPRLGIIGFGGGYGMDKGGFRYGFASNMVQANLHGVHRWKGWMPAVPLDGMIMIMSRKMLDAVDGIPSEYRIHHFYDLHMNLASVFAGFHNYVLFIRCQHLGGRTRMAPELTGMEVYNHNRAVFERLWNPRLPVYVTRSFRLRQGIPPRITHNPHFFPELPPAPRGRRR